MDPIIYFDELDKVSTGTKGEDLIHALIHLTDPVQNGHVRDRYFHGIDLDLSKAVFVFSYNDPSRVNPILLDRVRRIRLHSPSLARRVQISNSCILPNLLQTLWPSFRPRIAVPEEVIEEIVNRNRDKSGMRSIERDLTQVIGSYVMLSMCKSASLLRCAPQKNAEDGGYPLDLEFARSVLTHDRSDSSRDKHLTLYS
jgi:ATP-dependent Lon protease